MPADPLRELLTRADASAGPPPRLPDDLARRARGVVRARRLRREVFVGTAAVVALVVGLSVVTRIDAPSATPPTSNARVATTEPPDAETLLTEIRRLRAEVASYQAVARRTAALLEENQRLTKVRLAASQVDPLLESRLELNQAAFILVRQGDQLSRELNQIAPAIERYRETIRLFPDSTWAGVAAERLAELIEGEIS